MIQKDNKDILNEKIRQVKTAYLRIAMENDQLTSKNTKLQLQIENLQQGPTLKERQIKSKSDKVNKMQSSCESKRQNISALEREVKVLRKVKIQIKCM